MPQCAELTWYSVAEKLPPAGKQLLMEFADGRLSLAAHSPNLESLRYWAEIPKREEPSRPEVLTARHPEAEKDGSDPPARLICHASISGLGKNGSSIMLHQEFENEDDARTWLSGQIGGVEWMPGTIIWAPEREKSNPPASQEQPGEDPQKSS